MIYSLLVLHSFAHKNGVNGLHEQAYQADTETPKNRLTLTEFY